MTVKGEAIVKVICYLKSPGIKFCLMKFYLEIWQKAVRVNISVRISNGTGRESWWAGWRTCVFVFLYLCFVFVFALEDLMHPLPIASKIRRTGRQGNLDLRDPDDNDNQGWIQKQEWLCWTFYLTCMALVIVWSPSSHCVQLKFVASWLRMPT